MRFTYENMPNKERKEKKLIQLWVTEDKWADLRKASDSVEEPITTWCRRAIFAALRRWEVPESKAKWPKCSVCGKKHDEKEHFQNIEGE